MSVNEKMTALADAIREKSGVTGKLTIDGMTSAVKAISSLIVASASGNPIVLNDSTDLRVQSLRLFGKTTQNGTPTPEAPVPLVSAGDGGSLGVTVAGKNLFYIPVGKTSTVRGVTMAVQADGSILVNGTKTESAESNIYHINIPAAAYAGKTMTLRSDMANIRVQVNAKQADGTTVYLNVKNGTKTIVIPENTKTIGWQISIDGTGSYSNVVIHPYAVFGTETGEWEPYKEPQTLTLSTPNGLPGIPVTSGGNYTDETGQQWICDEVDFSRGVYVQRVFEIDIANNLYGGKLVPHDNPHPYEGISRFTYRNETGLKPATSMLSNRFMVNRWNAEGELLVPHGTAPQLNIQIKTERLETDDLDGLVAYANENQILILAECATLNETPLSAEELAAYAALHTNYPNTTILNDGGAGMEVKYVADTKLYIDNKINAMAAAIVNA